MTKVDPMKGWYSAQELAGLPGMPSSYSAVIRAAKKNLWVSRTKVRRKGVEYAVKSLPESTRSHILGLAMNLASTAAQAVAASGFDADEVKSVIVLKPGVVAVRGQMRRLKSAETLSDKDVAYRDASIVLCRAIEGAMAATDCSIKKACEALADRLVAFRYAQMSTRARPLVYYSDNGAGQTGKMIDHPIAGTLARQCIAHETGIPGNPQARGIIERIWQITLIALAREYPTCTWRGADENATNKMLKLLNRKDQGGIVIPSFRQLLDDVERIVNDYNLHHEHRELGGNTPENEYQKRLDKDSIVFGPSDDEIHALWMPETVRKPQRGLVSLFGNVYAKRDLVELLPEGAQVRVRYDLHKPEKVWLLTMEGMFIGEAVWNGHREAAFPVSEMDRLRGQRADRKIKRAEKSISKAIAELGDIIDVAPITRLQHQEPDYMPLPVEEIEESAPAINHQDMVMWLYGQEDQDEGEGPSSEVAAG